MIKVMSSVESGFTLAELLIALAVLGVIATFTIPKILGAGENGGNTAIAKEAASMVSSSFSSYILQNGMNASATGGVLTTYMNYVSVDTATDYDAGVNQLDTALDPCTATLQCLKLHNGGIMQYDTAQTFGSTTIPGAIVYNLDPDGPGAQGRISFIQYANGRLVTGGNNTPTATHGGSSTIGIAATDPRYLSNWE